ncbi:hypothetical protein [Nitrosophilus alvini]|uniref:hypothetical protein n=1 Tax=Nitrosophilus alvini TaxID=2714855 RepID=UPI00190A112E|nr:hypothetical protein [Nitrosophilus alvini]
MKKFTEKEREELRKKYRKQLEPVINARNSDKMTIVERYYMPYGNDGELSVDEIIDKLIALDEIDPNEGTDEEFFKKVDEIVGERFDIPMTPVTNPRYNELYLDIMKDRYLDPTLFRKVMSWD